MSGTSFINKLILPFVGYYDDVLFQPETNDEGELVWKEASATFKPRLVILSRRHYHESLKKYAISEPSELKKVLALKRESNPDVVTMIAYETAQGFAVSEWQRNQEFSPDQTPNLWLPESLLLANVTENDSIYEVEGTKSWYLYNNQGAPVSVLKGGIVSNTQLFKESVGIPSEYTSETLSQQSLFDKLTQGLAQLNWFKLTGFKLSSRRYDASQLKRSALLLSVLVIMYGAFSSAYLYWRHQALQESISSQQGELEGALNLRREYNSLLNEVQTTTEAIMQRKHSFMIWKVLYPLIDSGMLMTNLVYSNNRYVLSGRADKATTMLRLLSEDDTVENAKFDMPVGIDKTKERFVISFNIITAKDEASND